MPRVSNRYVPLVVVSSMLASCTSTPTSMSMVGIGAQSPVASITSVGDGLIFRNSVTIEETTVRSDVPRYRILLPTTIKPEDFGKAGEGPDQLSARLTAENGEGGPTPVHWEHSLGAASVVVEVNPLPHGFESTRLTVRMRRGSAEFLVRGLRTLPPRPRLSSQVKTPSGVIEVIGLRDLGLRTGSPQVFGGVAFNLPHTPGLVGRLRGVEISPAYLPPGGSALGTYVGDDRMPAFISNEGYGYQRWEARGSLDLLRITEEGEADGGESPIEVVEITPGKQWRIGAKGTIVEDEDVQFRVDEGLWQAIYSGSYVDRRPRRVRYRTLKLVRSESFALQADAINDVRRSGRATTMHPLQIAFDYREELDRQARRGETPMIVR